MCFLYLNSRCSKSDSNIIIISCKTIEETRNSPIQLAKWNNLSFHLAEKVISIINEWKPKTEMVLLITFEYCLH